MFVMLPIMFVAVPPFIWSMISRTIPFLPPMDLVNKNITLLISHPDDEVMFFGPTLGLLSIAELNNTISVVSLSSGNAEGLGETRKKELAYSAWYYEIHPSHVHVYDDEENLPDAMDIEWSPEAVSKALSSFPAVAEADAIITFDKYGISGHKNHIGASEGAELYVSQVSPGTQLWTLKSVPLPRKFIMFFDSFISYFIEPLLSKVYPKVYDYVSGIEAVAPHAKAYLPTPTSPDAPLRTAVIVSRHHQFMQAKTAMIRGHVSQMKWYRHAWVIFSRYMVVNDLVEVHAPEKPVLMS